MTVEVEYQVPDSVEHLAEWQVLMAKQIESNQDFPIDGIERVLSGDTFLVRVDTDLPNEAVENILSDIEDHLPTTAENVETREV